MEILGINIYFLYFKRQIISVFQRMSGKIILFHPVLFFGGNCNLIPLSLNDANDINNNNNNSPTHTHNMLNKC